MVKFRTLCFPLISVLALAAGCTSLYSNLQKTSGDATCLQRFKPVFSSAWYRCAADVRGHHLSGLLLMKKMPDSGTRLVFSNEMGLTFFDLGFSKEGVFTVYRIMEQLNKKPVLRTLQKDFELVLMLKPAHPVYLLRDSAFLYMAFPQDQGVYYYLTDNSCTTLKKMQRASRRKVVVEAIMQQYHNGLPDTIGISHKNFNFDIGLKKINNPEAQGVVSP